MKKLHILIAILAGFLFFIGCEEFDKEPVLDISMATGPSLTAPSSGGSYELVKEDAGNEFATFTWAEADYGFQASVTYILEIDVAGNNFANATQLTSTEANSVTMTVGEVNQILFEKEMEPGTPIEYEVRVKSWINDHVDNLMSSPITLTITAYTDEEPPLYMLGDATRAGWDNTKALKMESLGDGVYEIIDTLTGGLNIKFITTLGQWAPQYGTDGAGTPESGNLVLRPTENEPDPPPIQAPAEDGVYKITVDIVNLTYTISSYSGEPLYMLGDATLAGWDNGNAIQLQFLGDGVYEIVDSLFGGANLKFITTLGQWAPQYGSDGAGTWESGNLVLRPTEDEPDPASIPSPPEDGIYKITVDIVNLTYSIEEAGLYILGDATSAGWDNANPLPMGLSEPYVYTITTELAADLFYKFITNPGNWAPMYGTDDNGTETGGNLVYRPTEADPDPPAIQNLSAGTKTITCDLLNLTYTVTDGK